MKKSTKKALSLALALIMMLSLLPVSAFAEGDRGIWEVGDVTPIDLPEPLPVDPEEPEEEEIDPNCPEQGFVYFDDETGLEVEVEAPEGALPLGVDLAVTPVLADDYQAQVDELLGSRRSILVAMDISFVDEETGEEFHPNLPVTVKVFSPELAGRSDLTVVHIPDADAEENEPEVVVQLPQSKLGEELAANGIAFDAANFSVYAIVGDPDDPDNSLPYRTTYEFYNADGTPYEFKDTAGITRTNQILKDGEILEDVGIPTKGASQNAKFIGWYVVEDESSTDYGAKVEVGEAKSVTANTTIKLKAKLQGIVNVFFVTAVMMDDQGLPMARSIVTVKQVEFTVGQSDPIAVDTSDVTTEAPTSEQAVVGWNRDETAANAGTAEGTNGVITLYADGNASNITDVMLFPAVHDAYWLYFDENDGGTGGGASYTPPEFVMPGAKPTEPTAPHRTGYTFGGWYKDAACTQPFSFDEPLQQTTTVYANWVGAQTTYTIIVKVQSTTDSAKITSANNLSHDAKSYDFWKAYTVNNVQTGGTATVAQTYKDLANQIDSNGHIKYETCDADKTIAGDGSTVLYVYYQRDVMTIHWKHGQNQADFEVWYGLYNASFAESGKTWIEPRSGYRWRTSSSLLTFKDAFNGFDNNATTTTFYEVANTDSYYDIYFYIENLDGTWKLDHQFEFNATSFTFTQKYDAFKLYQYSRNGYSWYTATAGNSVSRDRQDLYIRYSRNSYDIEYHNGTLGTEGTIVRTDSLKYEAPLASHTNPTVTYPVAADAGHYDFIGWFADSGWKTMVTFTELDEQTKTNYRNWYGIAEFVTISKMPSHNFPLYAGYALKGWDCALDPNGGEFTNPTQAGVFWLRYGEMFSSDLKQNIQREGYIFQGWMIASVNGELDVVTRNGLRYVGNDSNWTMSETPWEFSTGIEGPTYLMAKWFYASTMKVVYDANGGTDAPADNGAYSDGATTVAFRAPVPPENKFFIGWDIVGTDTEEKLQPGATFTVSSDYAVDGVVTLKALYNDTGSEEEVPVTHIDWYANNTETGTYEIPSDEEGAVPEQVVMPLHVSDKDLQINAGIPIRPASTFTNSGYKFIGWAKLHDDNGTLKDHNGNTVAEAEKDMDYALTADNLYLKYEDGKFLVEYEGSWQETSQVAADEKLPYDDMYAVWELQYFYVYHSKDNTIEKIGMEGENWNRAAGTYNLTALTKEGTLYGGYYRDYGGKGTFELDKIEEFPYTVSDGTPYTGVEMNWDISNAYGQQSGDADGMNLKPVVGEIYYLKEVPATAYLQSYFHYTYHKEDGKISSAWLISDVDDNNYTETGFVFVNKDNEATVCQSLTVQNATGGTSIKLTPKRVFGSKGAVNTNLLTYREVMKGCAGLDGFADAVKILQYWVTPDGLIVTGIASRSYSGTANKDSVGCTDETVASTIALFVKEDELPVLP